MKATLYIIIIGAFGLTQAHAVDFNSFADTLANEAKNTYSYLIPGEVRSTLQEKRNNVIWQLLISCPELVNSGHETKAMSFIKDLFENKDRYLKEAILTAIFNGIDTFRWVNECYSDTSAIQKSDDEIVEDFWNGIKSNGFLNDEFLRVQTDIPAIFTAYVAQQFRHEVVEKMEADGLLVTDRGSQDSFFRGVFGNLSIDLERLRKLILSGLDLKTIEEKYVNKSELAQRIRRGIYWKTHGEPMNE